MVPLLSICVAEQVTFAHSTAAGRSRHSRPAERWLKTAPSSEANTAAIQRPLFEIAPHDDPFPMAVYVGAGFYTPMSSPIIRACQGVAARWLASAGASEARTQGARIAALFG